MGVCYNRELLTYCAGGPFSVCLEVRVWCLGFVVRYIGIELATFRLVAQCLNELLQGVP